VSDEEQTMIWIKLARVVKEVIELKSGKL